MTSTANESPTAGCLPTDTPDDVDIPALRKRYHAERDKRLRADGSHLGEPYGPGFYAFGELLAKWRANGIMEGMQLGS